jgi:hypothetical protein
VAVVEGARAIEAAVDADDVELSDVAPVAAAVLV